MGFWPYFYEHWNYHIILPKNGILALFLWTLEFRPYLSKHWNSYLDLLTIEILALSLYTLEFLSYPLKHWISGPIFIPIRFCDLNLKKAWDSSPIVLNHWSYDVILANTGILALFLYTLEFLFYRFKQWNSGPNSLSIWILILPLQTMEFWPYCIFIQIGILTSSFETLVFCCYSYEHWNSYLVLALQSLKFWPYFNRYLNSHLIHSPVGILVLFFYTFEILI